MYKSLGLLSIFKRYGDEFSIESSIKLDRESSLRSMNLQNSKFRSMTKIHNYILKTLPNEKDPEIRKD